MAEMFGGQGIHCSSLDEITAAVKAAIKTLDRPTIINISISPYAQRKRQKFDWLTRSSKL
mgnify:CR=1 FL=1